MNRLFIGRLIIATLVVVIGTLTFLVSPALAGNLAPVVGTSVAGTATTADPTPTATPTSTATPTPPPFLTTELLIPSLVILFVFCLLLIFAILAYVYNIQKKYYAITQSLSQMGVGVKAVPIDSFGSGESIRAYTAGTDKPKLITIDGPGFMTVGTPAKFTATKSDKSPADDAEWEVDPNEAASVNPTKGATVSVTPQKIGSFNLKAKIKTGNNVYKITDEGSVAVAAIASQATTEELPFIGQGYGSLVIAVLVIVAIILLALTGILAGTAVATLFGALLGYIFATHASAAATSSNKSSGKPPNTSS